MSLSQCHYDKPQSHSTNQTRWVIPAGKKIYAPSMKLLDLKIKPDKDCYFPALIGAYSAIKRVQIKLDNRLVDVWYAQEMLPLLIAGLSDNDGQKCINRALFSSGNNVVYDNTTKLLKLDRPLVQAGGNAPTSTLKLLVFSDLLNSIGVITSAMEIIIDWETDVSKLFCPKVISSPPTSFTIDAPYLSYETLNGDYKQPDKVPFRQWVQDRFNVPAIAGNNETQRYEIRSNAFNAKTIGRMVLVNTPQCIENASANNDIEQLYSVFGKYMSVPMKLENYNAAKDGRLIFSLRNVNNDSVKLSTTVDAWGDAVFVTNGHIHSKKSVLSELQAGSSILNGFASYGSIEINDYVSKELQLTYMRTSDVNATYPTIAENLVISAIAEVKCELVNGLKVYI
jgi:hypothetical protein